MIICPLIEFSWFLSWGLFFLSMHHRLMLPCDIFGGLLLSVSGNCKSTIEWLFCLHFCFIRCWYLCLLLWQIKTIMITMMTTMMMMMLMTGPGSWDVRWLLPTISSSDARHSKVLPVVYQRLQDHLRHQTLGDRPAGSTHEHRLDHQVKFGLQLSLCLLKK